MALVDTYDCHAFVTNRACEIVELEADHRRHAVCEEVIKDLKYGAGFNQMPSGWFAANAAWLVLAAIAHNLSRWLVRLGLGEQAAPITTKTFRARFLDLPGRLTRSSRQLSLHLPTMGPWAGQFTTMVANLRAGTPSATTFAT